MRKRTTPLKPEYGRAVARQRHPDSSIRLKIPNAARGTNIELTGSPCALQHFSWN
jgi:hypothetical protein